LTELSELSERVASLRSEGQAKPLLELMKCDSEVATERAAWVNAGSANSARCQFRISTGEVAN